MIILLALAKGRSTVQTGPITLHTRCVHLPYVTHSTLIDTHIRTAIWVAEHMTQAKFDVYEAAQGPCTIRCDGIGFTSKRESVEAILRSHVS